MLLACRGIRLELYAEQPDEQHPVVCFDETQRQLIGGSRVPVVAKPGRPARFDYEHVRNGTANVFMCIDAHRPWRHAKVTDRPHVARRCRVHPRSGGRALPVRGANPGRARQPLDPLAGRAVRDFRGHRSASHSAPARIPLHAEARELAEHGGDRDRRDGLAVPGPAHPEQGRPARRGCALGAAGEPGERRSLVADEGDRLARRAR